MINYNQRPEKGKSIIAFPSDYCVIDIETTGHCQRWDEILEIAAIKVENDVIVDTFSTFIKKDDDFEVSEFITDLTGITNEMLSSGIPIIDALSKFHEFIGSNIVVGHNVNFDINFLYDEAITQSLNPMSNDFIDTMRIFRKLYPQLSHHRLCDLSYFYSITVEKAHRALADCYTTQSGFVNLKKDVIQKCGTEEEFIKSFHKVRKSHSNKLNASDITSDKTDFDESHPFYNKTIVFTGTLERMIRRDAMQIVVDLGGINGNGVTAKTNYLVLGNNDYCSSIKNGKSNKQKKAEELKLKGNDIEIIPEDVFYDMI